MLDNQLVEKLQQWVDTHPESADTPFMNMSTGEEFTVRGLLRMLRVSAAGEAPLSESLQTELQMVQAWIGGS